jgi:hypothetical protein
VNGETKNRFYLWVLILQYTTQGICFYPDAFVGTRQRYIWLSNTYPDWNGRATQKGDQVFMHGDFHWPYGETKDGGHDGVEWDITTESRVNGGTGHWKEWIEIYHWKR